MCANCGARNKPRWEFCVRCNEALGDESPVASTPAPEADADGLDIPWKGWAASAVLLVGAVVAYSYLKGGPGEQPSPDLFTVSSPAPVPTALPSPPAKDSAVQGERLLAAGNVQAALPLLAEAVQKSPDDVRLLKLYAQALRRTGQQEAAVGELRRAVSLSGGEDVAARLELGRLLDMQGKKAEAAEAYASLLQVAPRNQEALGLLASMHTRAGRHAEALPLLKRLEETNPDDLRVRQDLAFALEQTGDEKAAIEQYTRVVAAMPGANIARQRLAEAVAREGDTTRAEAIFREGIALQPTVPSLHRSLGNLLERKGSYGPAAVAYREYARLAPNSPDAKALADRATQLERRATASS